LALFTYQYFATKRWLTVTKQTLASPESKYSQNNLRSRFTR